MGDSDKNAMGAGLGAIAGMSMRYERRYYTPETLSAIDLDSGERLGGTPFPYTDGQLDHATQERVGDDFGARASGVTAESVDSGHYAQSVDDAGGGLGFGQEDVAPDGMDDSLQQKWWLNEMSSGTPYYSYVQNLYKSGNEFQFNNVNYQSQISQLAGFMASNSIVYRRSGEGAYSGRQGLGEVYLDERSNICFKRKDEVNISYTPCYPAEITEPPPENECDMAPVMSALDSAYRNLVDDLCKLPDSLRDCILSSASDYLNTHELITGSDAYGPTEILHHAMAPESFNSKDAVNGFVGDVMGWANGYQSAMENILSGCASDKLSEANGILQQMAEISTAQTVLSLEQDFTPVAGAGGGGGGGGAEPLPMGNMTGGCVVKIDWWLWIMAILIITLNCVLITLAVRLMEDAKDAAAGAINGSAQVDPTTQSLVAAMKGAMAVWAVIGFVLFLVTWIYCALVALCLVPAIPSTPLATFPDPSVLLNKVMTLGGLRLRLLQPPSVNMGPLTVIANWVEDEIMEHATEWGDYAADYIGLSEGEAKAIANPGAAKPVSRSAGGEDGSVEIPNPFMEAVARGDGESLNAYVSSRTRISGRVDVVIDGDEGIPPEDKGKLKECANSILGKYLSDDPIDPSMGNLPKWCGAGDGEPLLAFTRLGKYGGGAQNLGDFRIKSLVDSWMG